jgi:hypothetical protein
MSNTTGVATTGRRSAASLPKIKPLAHFFRPLEDRFAMNTIPRSQNWGLGSAAAFTAAIFLWSLALGASPQLHKVVHPDANQPEHTCCAPCKRARSGRPIFYNPGADPAVGRIAIPRRQRFRARATRAGLARCCSRRLLGDATRA